MLTRKGGFFFRQTTEETVAWSKCVLRLWYYKCALDNILGNVWPWIDSTQIASKRQAAVDVQLLMLAEAKTNTSGMHTK